MDCSEFQAIVAGERESDLSPAESEAFESHLESCPSCREAVVRAEEDLERLSHLADPPLVAASAWTRVDAAVREQAKRKPGRENPFAADPVPAVAVALPVVTPAVAATRPVAAPRFRFAAPSRGPSSLVALAAMAAGVVVAFSFFVTPPEPPRRPNDGTAIKVKPPEEKDVEVVDVKVGDKFKQLKKQGPLVVITGQ